MVNDSFNRLQTARRTILDIFEHPPINSAEFEQRLAPLHPPDARKVLADILEHRVITEDSFNLYVETFDFFGVGAERNRLVHILANGNVDPLVRTFAMAVLAQDDPEQLNEDIGFLDPADLANLADLPLIEILKTIQVDEQAAEEVVDLLIGAPAEMQEFLLFQLGRCRRELDVSAVATYRYALREPGLNELHAQMIDAIVDEGTEECITFLTELRDSASSDKLRRILQGAIMRARTRAIDPERTQIQPSGVAYLGSCDGQGAFVLLGCFNTARGASMTADLCIRTAADIRDGFVIPRQSDQDLSVLMEKLRENTGCDFVSISLPQAAQIVQKALRRTESAALSVPDDALASIRLFERIKPVTEAELLTVEPVARVYMNSVRRLLQKPIYQNWFFDIGDLMGVKISPPTEDTTMEQWFKMAASRLNTPMIRERLLSMTQHMVWWHIWRDEVETAALCLALYHQLKKNFTKSKLVLVMLERTLEVGAWREGEYVEMFGRPQIRQYIKAKYFQKTETPTGRDLALLDFSEVALIGLEIAFTTLPGERRPRDEEKPDIAIQIGRAMRKAAFSGAQISVKRTLRQMIEAIQQVSILSEADCAQVGTLVFQKLGEFVKEVCAHCPVDCLHHPDRDVSTVFFSPHHPALDQ